MKPGQRVTYHVNRKEVGATVTAVSGTGASGKKMLDLSFEGGTAELVPHGDDREDKGAFWLLETETDTPPERRAPIEKQPIKLAEAIEAGSLPEADRRSE